MEISDKSEKCIHCGYPIRSIPYLHENINGKDYDVSFLLDNSMSQVKKMKHLTELSGCDLLLAKQIVLKYYPTKVVEQRVHPIILKVNGYLLRMENIQEEAERFLFQIYLKEKLDKLHLQNIVWKKEIITLTSPQLNKYKQKSRPPNLLF